jgi:HTH-type transcriptional regulator / antitoxin HigA
MPVKESAENRQTRGPAKARPVNGKAKGKGTRASKSYLALASAYTIHPIRSEEDLDEAQAVLDRLMSRGKPLDSQEQDYFDSLANEIERYEAEAYPMPRVSGAAMLRHLIEAREETLSHVAQATGVALSTLSAVLRGRRDLNLTHIKALAPHFGVEPEVFLD